MMISPLRLLTIAALGSALTAQALTITDGNMNFRHAALSASAHTPVQFDLKADALATDHGFEHWWYYRVAGDTREFSFRNIGGVTGGVTPFLSHADRDFADVDARGLLRAHMDFDTYDAGPASGVVTSRITLTNISAAPVTFDLFNYNDLDISDSFSDDVVSGSLTHHVVTDWTGVRIEIRADGSDHSEVGPYSGIRTRLTDSSLNNLADVAPPFSGDYTGAFQWSNRTLQPGEQRSFTVVFAVDTAANRVPEVGHYGNASSLGAEIYTDTLPLQDNANLRQIGIQLKGGVPGAAFGLLSNTQPAPGIPFAGLSLWVDPNPPAQFPIGVLTPTGEMNAVFVIPPSPYLTGFPIFHQYFYLDSNAPNGEHQHTAGLMTRVGRL